MPQTTLTKLFAFNHPTSCNGRQKFLNRAEGLARTGASPTRSDPEGSSRNEPSLGRCPTSHRPHTRAQNKLVINF